jgi:hypothetical protein
VVEQMRPAVEFTAAFDQIRPPAIDFAAILEAMQPKLDFMEHLRLSQLDLAEVIQPVPSFDLAALSVMNDVMEQFADAHRRLFNSFQQSFDFASLAGVTSLRPMVLSAVEEILAAGAESLQAIFRDKVVDRDDAWPDQTEPTTDGQSDVSRPFTLTVQQIWTLAWMMVLVMYLLALAGGGFNREELRSDIRAYAVTLMGALTFFGLYPHNRA